MVWILPLLIVGVSVALSLPTGYYLAWILDGRYRPPRWLASLEQRIDSGPQNWKQYAVALLLFNTLLFVFGFVLLALQPLLPLNPDARGMLAPSTIFNTAISFLTNTNLQHYAGEQHLSYFSQLTVILGNMFVSAGVGLCVLLAVIRGLRGDAHMGNYYLDMWRGVVYVLLPASLIVGVLLMATGVPMTFDGAEKVVPLEAGDAQVIARGPVAVILPIKHLGTNGGGFFGANSAHPFENPSAASNFLECVTILLFPLALVVMFGRMVRQPRHAAVIYVVMMSLFVALLVWCVSFDTLQPNPALTAQPERLIQARDANGHFLAKSVPALAGLPVDQRLGNLEGKELRFGTSAGATFAAITTAITCGSVNCMHDSLNPLAGLTPLSGMWLNCLFGGKGVGLVNLLVYLIIGVFLAGLMVGRTPEYLGKKVEAREMKLAMLALLAHPILVLLPTGLFAATAPGVRAENNPGAHGFSEILYEFSSASANNGSGFEGLQDTAPAEFSPEWDIATGLVMLLGRFLPILAPLALAGSLAVKKPTPFTAGTLRTDTATFGFVLLGVILLVGALLFLPAAVLGPVAEHLAPMPFGG